MTTTTTTSTTGDAISNVIFTVAIARTVVNIFRLLIDELHKPSRHTQMNTHTL